MTVVRKTLIITTIIWFAVVCFAPIAPGTNVGGMDTHGLQFVFPPLLLIVACLYEFNPKWLIWRALNTKLWTWVGISILAYTLVAWAINYALNLAVPTFGSYNTIGVLILMFLLILVFAQPKVGDTRAWLLASLAIFASVGFWESIYQICSWFSWYHTWFAWQAMVYNELAIWRPHPLMFIPFVLLLIYYGRAFGYKLNKWVWIPSAIFVAIWVSWYATGYWLLWYCDHRLAQPVWTYHTPINWVWYLAARGSKAVLAVVQVLLVAGIAASIKTINRKWLLAVGIAGTLIMLYVLARIIAGVA
jgi:hypothetical protein